MERFVSMRTFFGARSLATVVQQLGKIKYDADDRLASLLSEEIIRKLERFNSIDCAMTMHGIAYIGTANNFRDAIMALLDRYKSVSMTDAPSYNICLVIWALGKLEIQDLQEEQIWFLDSTVRQRLQRFDLPGLCQILYGFAKLDWPSRETSLMVLLEIGKRLQHGHGFVMQDLSNTLWASAKLQIFDLEVFNWMINELTKSSSRIPISGQELANTLWAISEFKNNGFQPIHKTKEVFQIFSGEIKRRVQLMMQRQQLFKQNEENLALNNVEDNCISNSNKRKDKIDVFGENQSDQKEFSSQNFSNILLAFSRVQVFNAKLFGVVKQYLVTSNLSLNPQEIYNILWACAVFESSKTDIVYDEKQEIILQYFMDQAKPQIDEFSTQGIANMFWSMAKLRFKDDVLIELLCEQVELNISDFKPQELSNILLSFAKLNLTLQNHKKIVSQLQQTILKLDNLNSQILCNSLWSLTILDCYNEEIFQQFVKKINTLEVDNFDDIGLSQLYQCNLLIKEDWWKNLNVEIQKVWEQCWKDQIKKNNARKPSQFSQNVYEIVKTLVSGECHLEYIIQNGMASTDIAIMYRSNGSQHIQPGNQQQERFIAIEIDGPTHFTSNKPYVKLSDTSTRNQFLKSCGWELVEIDFIQWNQLESFQQQRQYVQKILQPLNLE